MSESVEKARISYYETRTINIGDYESIQSGLTISLSVIEPKGGYGDKKAVITKGEVAEVQTSDLKEINKIASHVMKTVKHRLDKEEKEIRRQVADWEGMSFDQERKMVKRKLIEEDEVENLFEERHKITDKDLE